MADHADNNDKGGAAGKPAENAEATGSAKTDKSALPNVESPPLSPAGEAAPAHEPSTDLILPLESEKAAFSKFAAWRLRLKSRHKRQAMLAASIFAAAAIGAIIGARATAPHLPPSDAAALHERAAMQQSIADLNKEVAALKANVEAGEKSARSQIAKITERLRSASETTGSIPTPVVRDWRIFDVRNGTVAVQGHGDIYEIGLGAPLPGLGPVQQIKRVDGRWVVVTPKGIIVSLRDRRYFEP
jgi:hypothetical protein